MGAIRRMTSASDDLRLAADFPAASREDWRKLVDGVLKGAPFDKLVGRSHDGLRIEPIYQRAREAAPIAGRAAAAPWQIMQRIDHPDAARANAQALADLANGATGLTLAFAGANGSAGYGLEPTADAIDKVLDGVLLDAGIAIELQVGPQSRAAATHLADHIRRKGIAPAACDIRFGLDPIGACAVWGSSPYAWPEIVPAVSGAIQHLAASGFRGPFAAADGRVVHDAGGSEAQELAFVLAAGVAYLRALESAGIPLEDARSMVYARLSADSDQFLTMAKFRALRMLWARVERACGLAPKPVFIAAETAWRILTRRDPYVNVLRATMATFSAGLGGANAIAVLPHTLALGLPDPFARRVARNTQLVLLEESNLARVADPAAGSGGIETLTRQLCEAAWSLFQEIEQDFGPRIRTGSPHRAGADGIEAETDIAGRGRDALALDIVGEVGRGHAGLRADLEFDRDPGIEQNAVEYLVDGVRGRLQSIPGRTVSSRKHQRQSGGAVLEIGQRLRVGLCRVGMIDPLHDLPWRGGRAAGNRRGVAGAQIDRLDPQTVMALPTSFSNGAPFSTPSTSLRQSS